MFYALLAALILAHVAAYFLWQRFTRHEVAVNAEMIRANGSADDLRKGFHQRRGWVRFWPWLGLSVGASLPGLYNSYWVFALSFLSLGILLAGYFARFFTPLLNLAMGLDYKPEFYASPDSASWPDAAVWKQTRAEAPLMPVDRLQGYANMRLAQLLTRTWLLTRIAYAVGMIATLLLLFLHY